MARLTISISENLYNRISGIAAQSNQSMSSIINQLLLVGIKKLEESDKEKTTIDAHCQQLTLQMNVLIKKMSEKLLDLTLEDFLELRNASVKKYEELSKENIIA